MVLDLVYIYMTFDGGEDNEDHRRCGPMVRCGDELARKLWWNG